jgi:hypothetical protein
MIHGAMLALADDRRARQMIASMVTLLMMPITLVNHAVVTFGLNAMRTSRLTGRQRHAFRMGQEIGDLGRDDLLRVARPEARLHHRGRIDVDLDNRGGARRDVALEIRRDVDHEGVGPLFISGTISRSAISLRRLKQRRQERMGDSARQFGMILVDESRSKRCAVPANCSAPA